MIFKTHSIFPRPRSSPSCGAACWCLRATLAVAMVAACGCATSRKWVDKAGTLAGLRDKSPPEAEWNAVGLWQRVAEQPPTYIPRGYPATAPRDDRSGQWFSDKRDGKQVFAPHSGANGYSGAVLRAEARKVTE